MVEIRITYCNRQKYMSTGVMLYPDQWKSGRITNHPDIVQVSRILDTMVTDVREVILDMMKDGHIDLASIPDRIEEKRKKTSFTDYCSQRAGIRKFGKRKDTQERYDRFMRHFTQWGGIRLFEDVSERKVLEYDKCLTAAGMKPYSRWNNYHRFLNSFIRDAIDEGLLRRNPYNWISLARSNHEPVTERYLTPEEFHRLRDMPMPTECIERVRDVFVFQTYTCLSYTDLRYFDYRKTSIVKGMTVYTGKRNKTGSPFIIPLLQPALNILYKYNKVLPVISNVKYNEYLKVAAQTAGIDKPVSTHWARHTGATLLLNEGVPMQIVSRICGHSSTRMTEKVYARLLDETVVDAVSDLGEL